MGALDEILASQGQQEVQGSASSGALDSIVGDLGNSLSAMEAQPSTPGSAPNLALPDSPLSALERAAFGKLGNGKDGMKRQYDLLSSSFGKKNVQLLQRGENEATFVVKGEDGQWKQVDPAGLSDVVGEGITGVVEMFKLNPGKAFAHWSKAADIAGQVSLKGTALGAAQIIGAEAPKMVGASMGGAKGAAMGAPLGPIGAVGGALIGAGVGAMTAATGEMAVDAVQSKLDPSVDVGPSDMDDFQAQVAASFIYGVTQEGASRVIGAGAKGIKNAFTSTIKKLSATPEGKASAAKMLEMAGLDKITARTKVENPMAVARYTDDAIKDTVNRTSTLAKKQRAVIQQGYEKLQAAKGKIGKEYDVLDAQARTVKYEPGEMRAIFNTLDDLKTNKYITPEMQIARQPGGFNRELVPAERKAINMVINQAKDIADASSGGKKLTFDDIKIAVNNTDNYLNSPGLIKDGNLRRILAEHRALLKNDLYRNMPSELATKRAALDAKYAPIKNLMEDLAKATDDTKIEAFRKKIVKQDGSYNAELFETTASLLGTENPIKAALEMEAGRKIADSPLFTLKAHGRLLSPGMPRVAAGAATKYSSAKGAVQSAMNPVVPYAKEAVRMVNKLSDGARAAGLSDPKFVQVLQDTIAAGVAGEMQTKEQLLREGGVIGE